MPQLTAEARLMEASAHSLATPRHRVLAWLDRLLSEPLRRAPPAELTRYRLMTGASLFLFVFCLLYLLDRPPRLLWVTTSLSAVSYLLTLLLLRWARSPRGPSWLLCLALTQGIVTPIFLDSPIITVHASLMLIPALAVYLLGIRPALVMTGILAVALGAVYPLVYERAAPVTLVLSGQQLWTLHGATGIALLGAWGLGALHSTARDAAQQELELLLRKLSENEGKLVSLIESTDDLICSLDLEGRVIFANSAQRKTFLRHVGHEPQPGEYFFAYSTPERQQLWRQRFAQTATGQPLRFEEEYRFNGEHLTLDICINPILDKEGRVQGMTLFSRDVTARKEAEARMGEMHRTLVDVSRQAGMAEIATGVLHNVGNTLNSVNISTMMLTDLVRKSRVAGFAKAAQMLREHSGDLAHFLGADPQGSKLPGYLMALAETLTEERESMSQELQSLSESVDHIKSIVTMQQKHARTGGAIEEVHVPQLIDEALRLHAVSLERLGIVVERDYALVLPILVDRHKLLQILINLISNARHALVESPQQEKRLSIRVRPAPEGQRLLIEVADNGMGIAPENMARMFTQGFTTKKTGHGFGLHISALAATEMKGRLTCDSAGLGLGATFTLELPLAGEEVPS